MPAVFPPSKVTPYKRTRSNSNHYPRFPHQQFYHANQERYVLLVVIAAAMCLYQLFVTFLLHNLTTVVRQQEEDEDDMQWNPIVYLLWFAQLCSAFVLVAESCGVVGVLRNSASLIRAFSLSAFLSLSSEFLASILVVADYFLLIDENDYFLVACSVISRSSILSAMGNLIGDAVHLLFATSRPDDDADRNLDTIDFSDSLEACEEGYNGVIRVLVVLSVALFILRVYGLRLIFEHYRAIEDRFSSGHRKRGISLSVSNQNSYSPVRSYYYSDDDNVDVLPLVSPVSKDPKISIVTDSSLLDHIETASEPSAPRPDSGKSRSYGFAPGAKQPMSPIPTDSPTTPMAVLISGFDHPPLNGSPNSKKTKKNKHRHKSRSMSFNSPPTPNSLSHVPTGEPSRLRTPTERELL